MRPTKFRCGTSVWGFRYFVERTKLETPAFLRGDSFRIRCDITVFVRWPLPSPITVPPSEISSDLARLVDNVPGTPPSDVLIRVGAESFGAHALMLWMRCPELHRSFAPSSSSITITEDEVQPAAFRALLHYLYTERLSGIDGRSAAQKAEKLRGVLAAAVRYKVPRLQLLCESMLCASLNATTVVATLAWQNSFI